jgi:hypothetical protein
MQNETPSTLAAAYAHDGKPGCVASHKARKGTSSRIQGDNVSDNNRHASWVLNQRELSCFLPMQMQSKRKRPGTRFPKSNHNTRCSCPSSGDHLLQKDACLLWRGSGHCHLTCCCWQSWHEDVTCCHAALPSSPGPCKPATQKIWTSATEKIRDLVQHCGLRGMDVTGYNALCTL